MNMYYKSKFDEMFDDLFCTGISVTRIDPFSTKNTSTNPNTFLIDTDKYEIREKPEWRRKMLEQEISQLDSKMSHYQTQIEHLLSIQSDLKDNKKELKNKLKELDTKAE